MKVTIDASVHLNALNPHEDGSAESQLLIAAIHRVPTEEGELPHEVVVPMLLLVEIAASTARVFDDGERGVGAADAVRQLPYQTWVALDETLTTEAAQLGADYRLRGADAVYGAVARRYDSTLVTLDRQQLDRLGSILRVCTPTEAIRQLGVAPTRAQDPSQAP